MQSLALLLLCLGQAEFHPDLRAPDLLGSLMRPTGAGLQQDEQGVRITVPAGQGKQRPTGLITNGPIRGDFEATLSYAILHLDPPATGYGVGVSVYAAIDPNTNNAVSLARRVTPKGQALFLSNRMQPSAPRERVKARPSSADQGKLRLRRTGALVQFLVQEGADPDFALLDEVEFGTDEVRLIQIGANAGNADAGFDVRLLDFQLRADELPAQAAAVISAPVEPSPLRRRALWFVAGGLMLLGLASVALWWARRPSLPREAEPRS